MATPVMSVDMDEEWMPSNTASTLGTRDSCRRINENDVLDADEDEVDRLYVDITIAGVQAYHDSGTSQNPNDDTGGLVAYGYELEFAVNDLAIVGWEFDDPALNILRRNPGSDLVGESHFATALGFVGGVADIDFGSPESGDGVLERLVLATRPAAPTGVYPLTLAAYSGAAGSHPDAYSLQFNHAELAVGVACINSDADALADIQDGCALLPGPPSNNGCPLPGPPAVGGTAGLLTSSENASVDRATGDDRTAFVRYEALVSAVVLATVACLGWRLMRRRLSA